MADPIINYVYIPMTASDTVPPSVTINQAEGQSDPSSDDTLNFIVGFSEKVTGFEANDILLEGTAGASKAEVTPVGSLGTSYNVAVSGMKQSGTVIASVKANAVKDTAGNENTEPSTSTDNQIEYKKLKFIPSLEALISLRNSILPTLSISISGMGVSISSTLRYAATQILSNGADLFNLEMPNTVIGLEGDDAIIGANTLGWSVLFGNKGKDTLTSLYSNDSLYGGPDNDTLISNYGKSWFDGGLGDDFFYSSSLSGGGDVVYGEFVSPGYQYGNDTLLAANKGGNQFFGSLGNDLLVGSISSQNTFHGGVGNDSVLADGQQNELYGDNNNDFIQALGDQNTLYGNQGDDTILANGQGDSIIGGGGNDFIQSLGNKTSLYGGDGNDSVLADGQKNKLYGVAGNDFIQALGDQNTLYGDQGNDTLIGGVGNDTLLGGTEKDRLDGGGGNNSLSGGPGDDTLYSSQGNNTLTGGEGKDLFLIGSFLDRNQVPISFSFAVITDFIVGTDKIGLSGVGFSQLSLIPDGSNISIKLKNNGQEIARLMNVNPSQLTANDFLES